MYACVCFCCAVCCRCMNAGMRAISNSLHTQCAKCTRLSHSSTAPPTPSRNRLMCQDFAQLTHIVRQPYFSPIHFGKCCCAVAHAGIVRYEVENLRHTTPRQWIVSQTFTIKRTQHIAIGRTTMPPMRPSDRPTTNHIIISIITYNGERS